MSQATISEETAFQAVISQLWIYPIKSLKGILCDTVQLERRGFQYDRRWMLVDSSGHFLSQRKISKMVLIEVALSDFGLALNAPDMPNLIIPYPDSQIELYDEMEVTCWDDKITAQHINTAIDNWFSEFLDVDCQLVYMPDKALRPVDPAFARCAGKGAGEGAENNDITSFSDGFPNLIISEASLEDLNNRVDIDLSIHRFRPNIVVSGCEPYAEDTFAHFRINNIDFYAVKPCSRCIVTTINPVTGKKESKEPLKTLAQYRNKNNKVYFGQNLLHKLNSADSNQLNLGDRLDIVESAQSMTFD